MMEKQMAKFVGVLALIAAGSLAAQTRPATPAAAKKWVAPRTSDGKPDLQGTWVNFDSTPFERPGPGGASGAPASASEGAPVAPGSGNEHALIFTDRKPLVEQRASMVVEPASGRVPLTPWAEQQRDYALTHVQDSWEYNTPWERCITRGIPAAIFPAGYNNGYQILQTPGQVVILYEMIHEARVIPVSNTATTRPHLPASLRLWNGDPRGHWEGDTLVVETTNFNGRSMIATSAATARIRSVPQTENARIVERFTRTGPDEIQYEVTIDDSKVATTPWKVAMPLVRDNSYRIFEYMCHEANQDFMEITLGGGRLKDKAAENAGNGK